MADIRKDQERDELHRAIWAIADGLRGSVDGWDFKSLIASCSAWIMMIVIKRAKSAATASKHGF